MRAFPLQLFGFPDLTHNSTSPVGLVTEYVEHELLIAVDRFQFRAR